MRSQLVKLTTHRVVRKDNTHSSLVSVYSVFRRWNVSRRDKRHVLDGLFFYRQTGKYTIAAIFTKTTQPVCFLRVSIRRYYTALNSSWELVKV